MRPLPLLAVLSAVCAIASVHADVVLGTLFRDGAVLQRGKPVPVWGLADPGEEIAVSFGKQSRHTKADENGRWQVKLSSLKASSDPAELVVAGHNTITVHDVVVGEVWLCSGQSNMALPVSQTADAKREIAEANHPMIRHFTAESIDPSRPLDAVSVKPIAIAGGKWEVCSPDNIANFTAAGYYFARDLQPKLGVPIGLVMSTLGGSPIEGWISQEALASDPAFKVVAERWEEMRPKVKGRGIRNEPSGLYNGLIYPLEPFAFAGILWYQGEGNAARYSEYPRLFSTMIQQWRRDFHQEDLPFLFVQLPNWGNPADKTRQEWAWQRESQVSVLKLPHVHNIVTLDIGDEKLLHPKNKQEVGRRLSLVAEREVYGMKVEDTGPDHPHVRFKDGKAVVTFKHAAGLHFTGATSGDAFELAGDDRRFVPATGAIDGDTVTVVAEGLAHPVALRFDWRDDPTTCLFNDAGLPAAPFRTDDWPAP